MNGSTRRKKHRVPGSVKLSAVSRVPLGDLVSCETHSEQEEASFEGEDAVKLPGHDSIVTLSEQLTGKDIHGFQHMQRGARPREASPAVSGTEAEAGARVCRLRTHTIRTASRGRRRAESTCCCQRPSSQNARAHGTGVHRALPETEARVHPWKPGPMEGMPRSTSPTLSDLERAPGCVQ